jgi:hypothetical protein
MRILSLFVWRFRPLLVIWAIVEEEFGMDFFGERFPEDAGTFRRVAE